MEQLVLLLVIGAISLINWLIEQSGKRREQRRLDKEMANQEMEESASLQPVPAPVAPTTEPARNQEIRRFLESFGVPLPDESDVVTAERDIPVASPAPKIQIPVLEAKPAPVVAKQAPSASGLKSPAALRHAIVWREILGPPRSLQPF